MAHISNHSIHNRYFGLGGMMQEFSDNPEDEFMVEEYEDIDLDIQEWMLLNSPYLYELFYDSKKPQ